MSPEVKHARPTRGWAKHVREAKSIGIWFDENPSLRPTILTPDEKQRRMTIASWSAVCGLINLAILNDPDPDKHLEKLFTTEATRDTVRGWFEVSRFDAINGGSLQRDAFRQRFEVNGNGHRAKGPTLLEQVAPLTAVVDQAIFRSGGQPKKR